jgi:two-component system NtrC family sensor kinase
MKRAVQPGQADEAAQAAAADCEATKAVSKAALLSAARERIHQLLHANLQIGPALKEIANEIATAAELAACGLLVLDEQSGSVLESALVASAPEENLFLETAHLKWHPDGAAAYQPSPPGIRGWQEGSVLQVCELAWPLALNGQLLGILICARRGEFEAALRQWLSEIAATLTLALNNARLLRQAQQTSQQLIAELSKRQQEIEMQKRLTEKVIDSLPVSLYVVDRQLRIVAWNRNREIGGQGIERQQVIGRSVLEVFHKMPREVLQQEFECVFTRGEALRFEQESNVEGVKHYWLISKIPMRLGGEEGEVTHVITLGEQITEQKKMNEAIIRAEKLAGIGRLASGVVHEINNPLATIAACAEALQALLEEGVDLPEETLADFREYLKIINDEAFRCKTITNSLLDFSRQRQAEKTQLKVNYLIEQTLQLIKHHPKFKRLEISQELDETLPPIYGNEAQLKQVFIAIISNAFDAMDEQGRLRIRSSRHDHEGACCVGVEFIDNGCGIPSEDIPKIFEPFFTTKPFGQGTGLGLAVCYGIVSDHGGRIEVDSQVGCGTTVRVLLPPCAKG